MNSLYTCSGVVSFRLLSIYWFNNQLALYYSFNSSIATTTGTALAAIDNTPIASAKKSNSISYIFMDFTCSDNVTTFSTIMSKQFIHLLRCWRLSTVVLSNLHPFPLGKRHHLKDQMVFDIIRFMVSEDTTNF